MFSRHRRRKPLTPLEQLLMDYIWPHPECTAEMCREGIAAAVILLILILGG